MKTALYWYFRRVYFDIKYIFETLFEWDWGTYSGAPNYLKELTSDIIQPFRSCKYGIRNLFAWFKIIWFDRDWDHCYLEAILKFKIERMRDHISKHANHTEWERDVKSMQFVIDCLDRIEKDEYRKKLLDNHEEVYGKLFATFSPFDETSNVLDFCYDKSDTEIMKKMATDDIRKINALAEKDKTRDYKLLGSALAKYIRDWWD